MPSPASPAAFSFLRALVPAAIVLNLAATGARAQQAADQTARKHAAPAHHTAAAKPATPDDADGYDVPRTGPNPTGSAAAAHAHPAAAKPQAATPLPTKTAGAKPEPTKAGPPVVPPAAPPLPVIPPPIVVPTRPTPPPPPAPVANDAPGVARTLPDGLRVTFGDGRADLNPQTSAALHALVHAPPAATDASFTVTAYAGGRADDPSTPRRLSLSRALAVRSVLISEGVASVRIYVKAFGASAPTFADGPPDRVDVTIVTPPAAGATPEPASPASQKAAP